MPGTAAVVAALIVERPLCMPCLIDKAGGDQPGVEAALTEIDRVLFLQRLEGRCRACGTIGAVLFIARPAVH